MQKQLELVIVKLCETLPGDRAPLEKDGFCQIPSNTCKYYRKNLSDESICYKKGYTPLNLKLTDAYTG